jgi:predicted NUDIX family NTP pyrophosphohydrolase
VPKSSAGLLLYRTPAGPFGELELLIVHPGGPLWAKKDAGAWSIPKGEHGPGDSPASCAAREFGEELGAPPPDAPWTDLGEIVQRGGKRVHAWAARGDLDVSQVQSNTFDMEWPPRSGRIRSFPEIDKAAWVTVEEACNKLLPAQVAFVDRLLEILGGTQPAAGHDERSRNDDGPSPRG